jgi:hypothetical protein
MRYLAWSAYNGKDMKEWGFAQTRAEEQLAEIHQFSMMKQQAGGEVEFLITVKEYVTPKEPTMHFFAQADKMTNQNTAPYRPCGWGKTMLEALSECVRSINRFPYEGA